MNVNDNYSPNVGTTREQINSFKSLLSKLSYCNAAEGSTYFKESPYRKVIRKRVIEIGNILCQEGIDVNDIMSSGNYLVSLDFNMACQGE